MRCNTLDSTHLLLNWEPPKYVSKASIQYKIQYFTYKFESFVLQNSKNVMLSGLDPRTDYNVTVAAVTKDDQVQGKEEMVTCRTSYGDSPVEPDFDFTIMHSSSFEDKANVLVKWQPDLQSGHPGSLFYVGYKLLSDEKYKFRYPKETVFVDEILVPDLIIGNTYNFWISAMDNYTTETMSQTKDVLIVNRPINARFETSSSNDDIPEEEEYSSVIETECSVPCGEGVKTKIIMVCQKSCFPDCCQRKVEETPCEIVKCKKSFGPWSDWSDCTKPCVSNIGERSVRIRSRICLECEGDENGILTHALEQLFLVLGIHSQ